MDEEKNVIEITEKIPISDYGTIGLYYFKYFSDFEKIYKENKQEIIKKYKETYIAPMCSYLINSNKKIKAKILNKEDFVVLGTLEDIISFDENYLEKNI